MTEQNFTPNADGSVDLPINGTNTRFVKESDLLAVKGGSETKAKEWEVDKSKFSTDLAEANRLREESHTQLLQERATKEQLVAGQADYDTFKTKVGELETELGSTKESFGKLQIELAERLRQNLITGHGATEEAIKEKNLDQLRNLEEAAKLLGAGSNVVKPANFGGDRVPGDGATPEAPIDRAKRIIEEHERKHGRMQVAAPGPAK